MLIFPAQNLNLKLFWRRSLLSEQFGLNPQCSDKRKDNKYFGINFKLDWIKMERFAKIKNVGKRCKLDVKAICRCCGLASDDKEEILGQYSDDGVYFFEKVEVLTGKSHKNDFFKHMLLTLIHRNQSFSQRQDATINVFALHR